MVLSTYLVTFNIISLNSNVAKIFYVDFQLELRVGVLYIYLLIS